MLRGVIIDDEALARRGLMRMLEAHPEIAVVGEAADFGEALPLLTREQPDAVFLDIDLGDRRGDGFDLVAALEQPPHVVFVTAHADRAVDAFAADAVNYLLKPVAPKQLRQTVERLERRIAAARLAVATTDGPMTLRTPGRTVVAPPDDLAALRADGDFTHVLLAGQAPLMILRTLRQFEAELSSPPFLRLDRSLIVNLGRLRAINAAAGGPARIVLDGLREPLDIGRTAATRLRKALAAT